MESLYALAGTSGLADSFDDLVAQRVDFLNKIAGLEYEITKASKGWNWDHYGGMSPDQYAAHINALQGQIGEYQTKIAILDQQAANLQAEKQRKEQEAAAEAERQRQAQIESERQVAEAARKAREDAAKTQTGTNTTAGTADTKTPTGSTKPWMRWGTPPPARADEVQPPAPAPVATETVKPLSVADQVYADRASAESIRRAAYLINQPGFDFGVGADKRNQFFGVGETMSGLGASFDIIAAITDAAKKSTSGIKGAEVLARAGVKLPSVPEPLAKFGNALFANLKAQQKAATPAPQLVETTPAGFLPPLPAGESLSPLATYAALGVGAFVVYKVARALAGKR